MDDSATIYDEIIYTEETNFNGKNVACKTQNVYILLAFLLITIALSDKISSKNLYYYFTTQN